MKQNSNQTIERWGIRYTGIVQGVGFRPLVSYVGTFPRFNRFVYNDSQGVYVEIQGCTSDLQLFLDAIQDDQPRLCSYYKSTGRTSYIQNNEVEFFCEALLLGEEVSTFISADTAPCDDCLKELERDKRRKEYPFINCTNCRPRYTIIKSLPYDRERTTMDEFPMCEVLRLNMRDMRGVVIVLNLMRVLFVGHIILYIKPNRTVVDTVNVWNTTRELINEGSIIAIKGLGLSFSCDARNDVAVQRLRKRKNRPQNH